MRTISLIKRSAKACTPFCIVDTDTAVERHPVINRCIVALAGQVIGSPKDRLCFLVKQAVKP